ncbi:MAG: GIY-YIG nuclease family protein [Agriterribacter sp.]
MITIQELLLKRGLTNDRTLLVRHKDHRTNLYQAYRNDKKNFILYQQQQGHEVFKDAEYIVSFIGEDGTRSRFVGVYKIRGCKVLDTPLPSFIGDLYKVEYELEEDPRFEQLKDRVIIDWGKGARSWVQKFQNDKEIVELQPGLHYQHFHDYFDFILSYTELREIVQKRYPDWKKMLSATNAVYLIRDRSDGQHYIGSSWGIDGLWGRWSSYVTSEGHGGNVALRELVNERAAHSENFDFTIMMLLPKTITPQEAAIKERLLKRKLGTREFGLNRN